MPLLPHEKIPLLRRTTTTATTTSHTAAGRQPEYLQLSTAMHGDRGVARTGPSRSAEKSSDGGGPESSPRARQQRNLAQTNATKAAVMPKPSAALTRFSPDPNMAAAAAVVAIRVFPHLPSSPVRRPHPPATSRRRRRAYRLNRRLPLRRMARRAVRSRPRAPIWRGRDEELAGRCPLSRDCAAGKEGAAGGDARRKRGAVADGRWKGRLLL